MSKITFNVVLVGAGEINFGSPEGPWNHTVRLEKILGDSLRVLALIDPDVDRSKCRIAEKRRVSSCTLGWHETMACGSVEEAVDQLHGAEVALVVLGCPPHFRGTLQTGENMDERLLKAFPRARGILVEKPVSAADPLTTNCQEVARLYKQADAIVSVGYMLRYLKTVQMMKDIMRDNNIVPLFINARYIMAYEHACKLAWWDKDRSCGPVVEQATHFVDLIRYLAGSQAVTSSVTTHTVEHDEEAGRLSKLSFDELQIEAEKRVPRLTVATWKHRRGTVASLCHGIALHGSTYSTEIDIIADGWILRLVDAYTPSPSLFVTRPGQASPELIRVEDDPFESEFRAIIGAIKEANKDDDRVLSPYDDALETYELTWLIRRVGERAVK